MASIDLTSSPTFSESQVSQPAIQPAIQAIH